MDGADRRFRLGKNAVGNARNSKRGMDDEEWA
jgi:hypothetical protein